MPDTVRVLEGLTLAGKNLRGATRVTVGEVEGPFYPLKDPLPDLKTGSVGNEAKRRHGELAGCSSF